MKKTPKKGIKKDQKLDADPSFLFGRLLSFLFFIGTAYYLTAFHNYNYLIKTEELSLFMPTKFFWIECMQKAGGLLTYIGCFLTQFFYYPWLGSSIFIGFLLLVRYFTSKAFQISTKFFPLTFIPSAMLLLAFTELGYLIYLFKSPGYVYSNLIGVLVVLGCLWTYRLFCSWQSRSVFIGLFILISYPLFGFYTLFAALLSAIYELSSCFSAKKSGNFYPVLTIAGLILLVPYIYFVRIYTRMLNENIYISGLPSFYTDGSESILWMPFTVLFLCSGVFLFFLFKRVTIGNNKFSFFFSFVLFFVSLFSTYSYSYENENFRTSIDMDIAISKNDWNGVLESASKLEGEPTRLIVMNTNLALQKLGIAGDKMFTYKNASVPYKSPRNALYLRLLGAKSLYFQYGNINYCYRWCMEDMVEYGMKVEYLKYMVKCSLLNREFPLAQKYINYLNQTLFHKNWAQKYQTYIDHPKLIDSDPEFKLIKPLLAYDDVIDGDGGLLEVYLLNNFAYMQGGPVELVELSLQCNLILKDINAFWPRFFLYVRSHKRIPVHYQEAAVLYSYLGHKVDIGNLNVDPEIMSRFKGLIQESKQLSGKPEEYCKAVLKPYYGDTFWYYYFFVKGLKSN